MKNKENNFSYYQWRSEMNYQVFLRFDDFDFESHFSDTLEILGFDKVERSKIKDITIKPRETKILKVTRANPRIAREITRSDFLFDKYGPESLSERGQYQIYRYRNVGMMLFNEYSALWELGVKSTQDSTALRMIFTRFLSYALADVGVFGFWGVPVDEGFVVMKPLAANFESVFIDLTKDVLITYDGVKSLSEELHILRLDSTLNNESKPMSREELMSFLSNNTNYLSYQGMGYRFRDQIMELSRLAYAYIYPEDKFRPRQHPDQEQKESEAKAA
ncbi:MAG: hypothetical protein CME62_14275 [Halobacteriovoraceae bacterium]|nr:hypothetical protein [Halobacteriovoraceae bacterium]